MKDVVKNIVDSNTNLNVSLMRFDRNANGGLIIFPFLTSTRYCADDFKNTVEAECERINAFVRDDVRGIECICQPAVFRLSPPANPETTSVTGAFSSGTTYDSPMDVHVRRTSSYFCQMDSRSETPTPSHLLTLISGQSFPSGDVSCGGNDNCLDELAEYMNVVDWFQAWQASKARLLAPSVLVVTPRAVQI